jgi:hypothetical protein
MKLRCYNIKRLRDIYGNLSEIWVAHHTTLYTKRVRGDYSKFWERYVKIWHIERFFNLNRDFLRR